MSAFVKMPHAPTFEAETYEYKHYLPNYPVRDLEPHVELKMADRGFNADPEMKAFLGAATKVTNLTACIGTEFEGIDLRQLSDKQKDEMALFAAKRGVLVFRKQEISIEGMLDLARYWGPLHVHSTTGHPAKGPSDFALDAVVLVWNDGTKDVDRINHDRRLAWHSDQSFEINTPGLTSLKVITNPPEGGDTIWSNSAALLSSFSPELQEYLSKLSALHSSDRQKKGALDQGIYIRRPQTDCIHPVVRVHPVTGMKALFVNPSYTRRIVGVPKAESDMILNFIYGQISLCEEFKVRVKWEKDSIVVWDNRVLWHTATYDIYPYKRHALRATPVGERPMSVKQYIKQYGKEPTSWDEERLKKLGENPQAFLATYKDPEPL
ncbi:TauD-domain-containing protein [Dacryopinax primogenitus]|uniref:TauD-domain-containing protein n=1 Tax=Dacryopinax primogenitus (strain DJM 731) TaxID=1858805 RepID=M5FY65_DACPD|nr:TauD-domain-containing protein [Dacryopinax primogenitus]EJT98501.1 TauD-domain-containing protein [Dacryopinax primogenitus]